MRKQLTRRQHIALGTGLLCALALLQTSVAQGAARVTAAVGLIQNFSALRALATEGIQRGHMGLHARNVAIVAGAKGADIDRVAKTMIERLEVREDVARELLAGFKG